MLPVTAPGAKANYVVRLGFSALSGDRPGQRVFDVKLNGQTVLKGFDILQVTGRPDRATWTKFPLTLEGNLTLELVAKSEKPAEVEMPLISGMVISRQ